MQSLESACMWGDPELGDERLENFIATAKCLELIPQSFVRLAQRWVPVNALLPILFARGAGGFLSIALCNKEKTDIRLRPSHVTNNTLTFLFFSWHSLHAIRMDLRFGSGSEAEADAGKAWPIWGMTVGSRVRYLGGLRAMATTAEIATGLSGLSGLPGLHKIGGEVGRVSRRPISGFRKGRAQHRSNRCCHLRAHAA